MACLCTGIKHWTALGKQALTCLGVAQLHLHHKSGQLLTGLSARLERNNAASFQRLKQHRASVICRRHQGSGRDCGVPKDHGLLVALCSHVQHHGAHKPAV